MADYELRHVAHHLLAAGHAAELHSLLALEWFDGERWQNAWYQTRVASGDTAGYLADVALAWTAADGEDEAAALRRQLRYALATTSAHSIAARLGSWELVAVLVDRGVWTVAHATAHARLLAHRHGRAQVLIAAAHRLPLAERERILTEAHALADSPSDEVRLLEPLGSGVPHQFLAQLVSRIGRVGEADDRARLLAELAQNTGDLELVAEALAAARDLEDLAARAEITVRLAAHLPDAAFDGVIHDVAALPLVPQTRPSTHLPRLIDPRGAVLAALAPALPERLIAHAAALAEVIDDPVDRAIALAGILPRLPEGERTAPLHRLLQQSDALRDYRRAAVIRRVAAYVPSERVEEAIDLLFDIEDLTPQSEALGQIAPHLTPSRFAKLLNSVLRSGRPERRAWLLATLAHHAPAAQQAAIAEAALATAGEHGRDTRVRVLNQVAPLLPAAILEREIAAARCIGDERALVDTLQLVADGLPAGTFDELLELFGEPTSWDGPLWGVHLEQVAARLTAARWERALDALAVAQSEGARAERLAEILPYVPEHLLDRVSEIAATISDSYSRARPLIELAARNPKRYLDGALATLNRIEPGYWYSLRVAQLAAHMPDRFLDNALTLARAETRADARAELLSFLAGNLGPKDLRDLLRGARRIQASYTQTETLARAAPHIPAKLVGKLIAAATANVTSVYDLEALRQVAPFIPDDRMATVMAAVRRFGRKDSSLRGRALAFLVPHLPKRLLPQVLADVSSLAPSERPPVLFEVALRMPEHARSAVLSRLVQELDPATAERQTHYELPYADEAGRWLAEMQLHEAAEACSPDGLGPAFHALATRGRGEFLAALSPLKPLARTESGQVLATALAAALRDAYRWWP
jgi:hypothetical protein